MRWHVVITLILVWQAVFAPAAMAQMSSVPSPPTPVVHAMSTVHADAADHGASPQAHCCDLAGHCSPAGLPSVASIGVPAYAMSPRPVSRRSVLTPGHRLTPYRPPSRLTV